MPKVNSAQELIAANEGRVAHAYQDSLGYWTIGIGHLIDARKGGSLPPSIIDALFQLDMAAKEGELLRALPWYATLDEVRKAALLDMAFNLGTAGLLGFPKALAAIRAGNYADAHHELITSRWAAQLPARANLISQMILTGEWPQ